MYVFHDKMVKFRGVKLVILNKKKPSQIFNIETATLGIVMKLILKTIS